MSKLQRERARLMKSLFVGLLLFASYSLALAQSVPLPRSKPQPVRADDPSSAQVLPLHDAQLWPFGLRSAPHVDREIHAAADT